MEKTRLFLTTCDEGMYVIKVSYDSDPSFSQGIYFTLNCNSNGSTYTTLEDIINWGRNFAKNIHSTLQIDEKIRKTN